jgi:hypothetical protein
LRNSIDSHGVPTERDRTSGRPATDLDAILATWMEALPMSIGWLRTRGDDEVEAEGFIGCVIALALAVFVCVSTLLAWREIMYFCFSRETDAALLGYHEPGRRTTERTLVSFEFTEPESGLVRRHSQMVPRGWPAPAGPLRVQFIPGADSYARVAGYTQRWALWMFGGSLLAAATFVARALREANSPIRRRRRRA